MKSDQVYLDHILEGISWIERFAAEGREAFFKDRKTQSPVLTGFRNILVHDYLGIKLDRV